MWHSPAGTETKNDILIWSRIILENQLRNQLNLLIDGQGLLLFFEFQGDLFGATEPNRVIFARMKSPVNGEKEIVDDEETYFSALNITQSIKGKPMTHLFYAPDVPSINVVTKQDVLSSLVAPEPTNVQPNAQIQ